MWIEFDPISGKPYIIKIFCGGVNAISGEPEVEMAEAKKRQDDFLAEKKSIQDYVLVPGQPWLDGSATGPGKVHQFIATALGKGKTVEAQITGVEDIGGLQSHITPQFPTPFKPIPKGAIQLMIRTLKGKVIVINASPTWQINNL
ncbi:uncharacterized protein DFL_005342 [Arthrobotrys flagrans]|uniref:Uncharacterized protein n=1 Tax=Arthrobotrys flagrans TaxID=97331 RepID=A0A437A7U3_ARTFL|nr:hypothetical protein DFL_005342 [Arthrobotrys flagrans]